MRSKSITESRPGLTLIEVLMSLFVTGIGVMSVISLLPLSFVRAVQATNLTNSTILRFNAESQLDLYSRLLPRWQAQTNYVATNDYVIVPGTPTVWFQCTTSGISGVVAPTWNTTVGSTTNDGGAVWTAQTTVPFVVDPLGWNVLPAAFQGTLGNLGGAANGILRLNAGATSEAAAAQLMTLPDSWIEQARGAAANTTLNSVDLPGPDLSGIGFYTTANATPQLTSRVVLTDSTGKMSHTRIVTGIAPATNTLSWTNDPLPTGFTVSQVRLETQERRYTWMLTGRVSAQGIESVDVTVFFRRPLSTEDEQIYTGAGSGTQFTIDYTNLKKPFAKKGGYLFDVSFGRWYRVVDILNDTGTGFTVIVDRQRPTSDGASFNAVFMRGIVDMYPLGNKS
jgi:Tfp pilus assembly protein PilV